MCFGFVVGGGPGFVTFSGFLWILWKTYVSWTRQMRECVLDTPMSSTNAPEF